MMKCPPDLRYKHVEAAFQKLHYIKSDELKAFRARFRHLRNIGIPELPKVGSGTQLTYTEQHVLELFIALELVQFGLSPLAIKRIVGHCRLKLLKHAEVVAKLSDKEFLLGFSTFFLNEEVGQLERDGYVFVKREDFLEMTFKKESTAARFLVINFSLGLRKLYAFLEDEAKI